FRVKTGGVDLHDKKDSEMSCRDRVVHMWDLTCASAREGMQTRRERETLNPKRFRGRPSAGAQRSMKRKTQAFRGLLNTDSLRCGIVRCHSSGGGASVRSGLVLFSR